MPTDNNLGIAREAADDPFFFIKYFIVHVINHQTILVACARLLLVLFR